VDAMSPAEVQLEKMKAIIESKGKPCCINMITQADQDYLNSLRPKVVAVTETKQTEGDQTGEEESLKND
jgi:hypothetical protein